jgi:hypothetical protein
MIVMNSTNSNCSEKHLFPELPPTRTTTAAGGGSEKRYVWFECGARWLQRVSGAVVTAAVQYLGQPLLRLPVIEFTVILVIVAMLAISLA